MGDPVSVDFAGLAAFFAADPNVVFAVVFGSAADGMVRPGSDLDVGILFREPPAAGPDYVDYYLRLCEVVRAVEKVDLVNLNSANTILAFEALRGRVVVKNDAERTAEFYSLTCREYEDCMARLRRVRGTAA
jgi:predicted nucleotidyltransferase